MKRFLSFCLAVCLVVGCLVVFSVVASAETEGYYTYTVSNGEATITKCSTSISGNVVIPSKLGGYPIKSIGNSAFSGCSSLASIEIPEGVTSIGYQSFFNCCNLVSITIPESVTSIGSSAFAGTGYYNDINNWKKDVLYIGSSLLTAKTTITSCKIIENTKCIAEDAFSGCSSLSSIEIPEGVISICSYAFFGCSSLSSIEIPESVTIIGSCAFSKCSSLASIEIPKGVKCIGSSAFSNCSSLASIEIHEGVTSIGEWTFYGCTSLLSIEIPESVTIIGNYAFDSCSNLKEITLSKNIGSISAGLLSSCTNLTSVTIPFIGSNREASGTEDATFKYIFGGTVPITLKNVTLTDVSIILNGSFDDCSDIKTVHIQSPARIYSNTFTDCTSLTDVYIESKGVSFPNSNIFSSADYLTIHGYPGSSADIYAKKYGLDFESLESSGITTDTETISNIVSGKIVLNVKPSVSIAEKALHIALYDKDNTMLDYMIIPQLEGSPINVVFKDNADAKKAKIFLWDSLNSMTPISKAEEIEIR